VAFSTCTITHNFNNPDGTPASGSVVFSLSKRMTNGTTSIMPGVTVTSALNGSGALSQSLYANNDAGTNPTDAQWRVDIRIGVEDDGPYFIQVPTGGGTVDLGTLLPQQPLGG
jgi:hypothetical protein